MSDHGQAATRAVYDAVAGEYARWAATIGPGTETELDRALIDVFVSELVTSWSGGRVADLGCGPGRLAAVLSDRGLATIGIDIAPAMVAQSQLMHPHIPVLAGSLDRMPLASRPLVGAALWYSIITTPPSQLPDLVTEVRRVLIDGALVLFGFQAGSGEAVHRDDAFKSGLALTTYRHSPAHLTRVLEAASFRVRATTVREPEFAHELTDQAFITAVAVPGPAG